MAAHPTLLHSTLSNTIVLNTSSAAIDHSAEPRSPTVPVSAMARSGWSAGLVAAVPSIVIGLVWVTIASANSIAELVTYNSTSRDIGVYLQMLWNTGHARPFQTTLLESNRIHLAEHVALLLPVLSPL